jgi:hypothetical protein
MGKKIIIVALSTLFVGCATVQPNNPPPLTEIRVPVLYCPAPPATARPELMVPTLTPEDIKDPGKVVQYYATDLIQVQGYAEILEQIVEAYRTSNQDMGDLAKRLEEIKAKARIPNVDK